MILRQLKAYIEANPGASVNQLAQHFHLDEDATMAMLQPWLKRHRINIKQPQSCSGGCGCEQSSSPQVFWVSEQQIGFTEV